LFASAKFLVAATKNLFVVPNFVAVTKPFFPVSLSRLEGSHAALRCRSARLGEAMCTTKKEITF